MSTTLLAMLDEPRDLIIHACHHHHDDDAVTEWQRGLTALIVRVNRATNALDDAFDHPHDGLLHPEQCIRHLRIAAARINALCVCPCAIDEPGTLLAAGASLARARASAAMCATTMMSPEALAALRPELWQLRSEMLVAVSTTASKPRDTQDAVL
ncbi:MAG: hypothetical protein JHC84_09050 [Solirubrobacteraceae bacterium]|nr:hypothetical protein [Solirubrobacteraceae bacterium]